MKNTLFVQVADLTCELIPDNKKDYYLLKNEYVTSSLISPPTYRVQMISHPRDDFMIEKKGRGVCLYAYPQTTNKSSDNNYVFYGLEASVEYLALHNDIMLLHASSFVKNGVAYVFCGPSGRGKSTIVDGVSRENILSDDTTVLRKIGKLFWVYTSPFDNKKRPGLCVRKAPLSKIFFLTQSLKTNTIQLSRANAIQSCLSNDLFYHYLSGGTKRYIMSKTKSISSSLINVAVKSQLRISIKRLYKLAIDLTVSVPTYRLNFTKNLAFLAHL